MRALRVGRISALNMYPIYHGLERAAELVLSFTDGVPTALNAALLQGGLDVSAVSSIAYARHAANAGSYRSHGTDPHAVPWLARCHRAPEPWRGRLVPP